MKIINIIFNITFLRLACCYKILLVSILPSSSHYNLNKPIAKLLSENHEVTFVTVFPQKNNTSTYREIGIPEIQSIKDDNPTVGFEMSKMGMVDLVKMFSEMQPRFAKLFFENRGIKKLLEDESERFDLAIIEYLHNEYLFGLGVKFNCPVVVLSAISVVQPLALMTGNPLSIATVPDRFMKLSQNMNFMGRLKNAIFVAVYGALSTFIISPINKRIYEQYLKVKSDILPFDDLKNKISLTFVNTHPSFGVPRPYLPNTIEIGGYHIDNPNFLPKDLQEIMDGARDGVIFFSMGSILQASKMKTGTIEIFIKSFGKLKETVLWKFKEEIQTKPDNLIIRNWLPQASILAHPKLKLFITHGGLLSCTESVHFGVPLVTIPVFGDQVFNAKTVEERGQGVSLDFENITETSLNRALNETLSNPKYKETAMRLQSLYNDRPMKPRDLITYYMEHVIRTEGAPHLSPPRLPKYSLLLLDIVIIILGVIIITVLSIALAIYKLCSKNRCLSNDIKKIIKFK